MKTLLSLMTIVMLSFLSLGTVNAQSRIYDCPWQGPGDYCSGLLAAVYVDTSAGNLITITFPAPDEGVRGISGPYAGPSPDWSLVNGQVVVNLDLRRVYWDEGYAWMEIAINGGGAYHVQLIRN